MRMTGMAMQVVRSDGVLALYNGLSASLCRQVSASAEDWAYLCVCAHFKVLQQGVLNGKGFLTVWCHVHSSR